MRKIKVICYKCNNQYDVYEVTYYRNKKKNNGYFCNDCYKKIQPEIVRQIIKNKWKDPIYRSKQISRKHTDALKQQARDRSNKLWKDKSYQEKYFKNFDPNKARLNLDKARVESSRINSIRLKEKWKDVSYKEKMSKQSKMLWGDDNYKQKIKDGFNKILTNEYRERLSKEAKERWCDVNYRNNWLRSFLDSFNDDRKMEISMQSSKNWGDDSYREKIESHWDDDKRKWMSNVCSKWWTDDKCSEISEIMLERWSDKDWRDKCVKSFIEAWTDERKQKVKEWWTPERRMIASERTRLKWKDPQYVQKFLNMIGRPSSLEIQFANILDDYKIKYEQQVHIGPYLFDFKINNYLIEIQGDYWHKLNKTIIKDKTKAEYIDKYFSELRLLYVWEHEFYQIEKINRFIENLFGSINIVEYLFDDLIISNISYDEAKSLFEKYHYKSSIGRGGLIIGVKLRNELIASCVFTNPTRNVPGGELTRFVIHPQYRKENLASWFLSRATKIALKEYNSLFTFADPNFNHNGSIYLASNWKYVGETKSDYWYISNDGWVMHKKTLWNKATNLCMKESEFAEHFGYKKVWGIPKKKYVIC